MMVKFIILNVATTAKETWVFHSSVVLEALFYKTRSFCVPEEASFKVLCATMLSNWITLMLNIPATQLPFDLQ